MNPATTSPTENLLAWIRQWRKKGSHFFLSYQDQAAIDEWIKQGADVNVSLDDEPLIISTISSVPLTKTLWHAGAKPSQSLVSRIVHGCHPQKTAAASAGQRLALEEQRKQWRLMVGEMIEAFPYLDWYEKLPKAMGSRFDDWYIPAIIQIEEEIDQASTCLERGQAKMDLPIGMQTPTQESKNDALLDLLKQNPNFHSLKSRSRKDQIDNLLSQGACPNQKVAANESPLSLALLLRDSDILHSLLKSGAHIDNVFLTWLGSTINSQFLVFKGAEWNKCLKVLLEENMEVFHTPITTPSGTTTCASLLNFYYDGIFSKQEALALDRKTKPVIVKRRVDRL